MGVYANIYIYIFSSVNSETLYKLKKVVDDNTWRYQKWKCWIYFACYFFPPQWAFRALLSKQWQRLNTPFLCFGRFGLQALEPAWITFRQIEARRRAITRYAYHGGKIWIRIFLDKPITMWPAETRMGSGKGSPEYWEEILNLLKN